MGFHEIQFPLDISYGSAGGPGYSTSMLELQSGAIEATRRWSGARRQYDVAYGIRSPAQLKSVHDFFLCRDGAANGFRYADPLDYTTAVDDVGAPSNLDHSLGVGDGTTTTFQLLKRYQSGSQTKVRHIRKPVVGTTVVSLNSVAQPTGWSVDTTTGIVTFTAPPAAGAVVRAGCAFDVPARFSKEVDELLLRSQDSFREGSIRPSIRLIEDIEPTTADEEFWNGDSTELDVVADITLTHGYGRFIVLNPTSAGRKATLPSKSRLASGGPHFVIYNRHASNSVEIRDQDANLIKTLAAQAGTSIMLLQSGAGVKTWLGI